MDTIHMPIYEIMDYCKYIERNGLYDYKAKSRHYDITYDNNKVIISLFNNYVVNDKIKTKCQETKIINDITLKEFCNYVISVYEFKLHIGETSDIELESLVKKIQIKNIK